MADVERERLREPGQPHGSPTVSELRALSLKELAERHDALVARSRETGEPVPDAYLGELGRRIEELRAERILRIALATLLASSAAVIFSLLAFIVAL
jgi:hypothetical protein